MQYLIFQALTISQIINQYYLYAERKIYVCISQLFLYIFVNSLQALKTINLTISNIVILSTCSWP